MLRDPSKFADHEYDVVVIGGGIYGACIAWDAALRGLSVALIERGDFGQETSANSLKTVHGGLRYLQDLDLKPGADDGPREKRLPAHCTSPGSAPSLYNADLCKVDEK